MLPTQQRISELFVYEGGVLRNRNKRGCKAPQGAIAGYIEKSGYRRVMVDGKTHMAHRLVWKLVAGSDPKTIDHIDGNKLNNDISNLRSVEVADNCRNKQQCKRNTSGINGVLRDSSGKKWVARITHDYKCYHLGTFETSEQALAARIAAEEKFGFHPNHGRTA